uniref:F-box domain-containing protein n=1 Tax=Panagrellus redivivus TaxID=6233 RepID=A0A7E4W4R6_PANRE
MKNHNILTGFDIQGLKSDIFGYFLRNAESFLLRNCAITKQFWETLKTVFPKVNRFDIFNDNDHLPISFTDLLTAFPNVYNLTFLCHISKDWLDEILQFGNHPLKCLTISFNSLELCDEFDCDRFAKFIKTRQPGFAFFMSYRGYPGKFGELHLARLTQKLDQILKRGCPLHCETDIIVIIHGITTQRWYLPLSKDV